MSLTYGFALRPSDASADFANALRSITGDGIAQYGTRFNLSVNGFTVTLSTGYAFAAGRWVENDEQYTLALKPSSNTKDRTDALVCRADYRERKATLEILVDVDPSEVRSDPSIWRNSDEYNVFLYFISVRRGATSLTPSDITDLRGDSALCGSVAPLSSIAGGVIRVYEFLTSGIDQEVARLTDMSEKVCEKADAAIGELDDAIKKAGGSAEIGDLTICRNQPMPENEWLLCDGNAVSSQYQGLRSLIGAVLPDISRPENRYRTYIYAGHPAGPTPEPDIAVVGRAIVGLSTVGKE